MENIWFLFNEITNLNKWKNFLRWGSPKIFVDIQIQASKAKKKRVSNKERPRKNWKKIHANIYCAIPFLPIAYIKSFYLSRYTIYKCQNCLIWFILDKFMNTIPYRYILNFFFTFIYIYYLLWFLVKRTSCVVYLIIHPRAIKRQIFSLILSF